MQARVGRKWRTFKQLRTEADGRFRGKYRFTQTSGRVRYVFRALVKRQSGYPYEPGSLSESASSLSAAEHPGRASGAVPPGYFPGLALRQSAYATINLSPGPVPCSTNQPLLPGRDDAQARPPVTASTANETLALGARRKSIEPSQ